MTDENRTPPPNPQEYAATAMHLMTHPLTGELYVSFDSLVDMYESMIAQIERALANPPEAATEVHRARGEGQVNLLRTLAGMARPMSSYGDLDEIIAGNEPQHAEVGQEEDGEQCLHCGGHHRLPKVHLCQTCEAVVVDVRTVDGKTFPVDVDAHEQGAWVPIGTDDDGTPVVSPWTPTLGGEFSRIDAHACGATHG